MGYYTQFELTIYKVNSTYEMNFMEKISIEDFYKEFFYTYDLEISCGTDWFNYLFPEGWVEGKWYHHEEDFKCLSNLFSKFCFSCKGVRRRE